MFVRRVCQSVAVMLALSAMASQAEAAPIFADTFNTENGGVGVLNYAGFANFAITGGTVDLIGNGFFDFLPGNGLYVDLDGSTHAAGLVTENGLALGPGSYALSFDLAGSQRGEAEVVTATVFGLLNPSYGTQLYTTASSDPFSERTILFTLASADTVRFAFANPGTDDIGALLDNVAVNSVTAAAAVPEPASLLLLGTGLFAIAARVRRNYVSC